jgi:hypothetical protein
MADKKKFSPVLYASEKVTERIATKLPYWFLPAKNGAQETSRLVG